MSLLHQYQCRCREPAFAADAAVGWCAAPTRCLTSGTSKAFNRRYSEPRGSARLLQRAPRRRQVQGPRSGPLLDSQSLPSPTAPADADPRSRASVPCLRQMLCDNEISVILRACLSALIASRARRGAGTSCRKVHPLQRTPPLRKTVMSRPIWYHACSGCVGRSS